MRFRETLFQKRYGTFTVALPLCVSGSGGKEHEGNLKYYPFRMTPYLMKVQDAELSEEQFCCLLLAERVHSGYEGETCG